MTLARMLFCCALLTGAACAALAAEATPPTAAAVAAPPTVPTPTKAPAPASATAAPVVPASADDAKAAASHAYARLDIPDWAVKKSESAAKDQPWILIVDDPQCPYCMQLSLGIEKVRENGESEVSRAASQTPS